MQQLVQRRAELLALSSAAGTEATYSSAFNSYSSFCTAHSLSLEPSPETLSLYVTYMASYIKPSSVASYLSGIIAKLEPYFPRAREARSHPMVSKTLQGALRIANTPVQRKRPLTTHDLATIINSLPTQPSHDDLLFCALTFTGFFGLLRPSEFCLSDSASKHDSRKIMLRHEVSFTNGLLRFPLHAHKADQQLAGSDVLLLQRTDHLDPVTRICQYLASRDSLYPLNPELWTKQDGTIPRYKWFVTRLKSLLPPGIGGASPRSGGADYLASMGADPSLIQAAGRWASEAYKVYLRTHPVLVQHLLLHGAVSAVHHVAASQNTLTT